MKLFLIVFTLAISAVYAEDAPYPPSGWKPQQQALLVLPPQFNNAPASNFQAPQQDEAENLAKINENVMERLRQEEGSERGVYYVYLPDGKLQRVQYTTAPVKQQDQAQQQDQNSNRNQQEQSSSNYRQQQYRPNQFNRFPNNNVQSNHQQVGGNNQNSFQGNQQQFGRYEQQQQQFGESTNQQAYTSQNQQEQQQQSGYQPQNNGYQQQYNDYQQQFGESRQQNYNQYQGNQYLAPNASQQQNQQNSDNKQAESGDPSQLLARYVSPEKLQNPPASNYVASVQFTDVPPISGPIYSYNPAPLVRIVRYASNYQ
uniref:Uncharacterized protein n=1 Tax=Pristhesancus plagipennis TaxID=1955184 RepID=A0A2K8JSI0_PRIPG|nr:secreted hypothetical protein [Pristhesancus plagipennis]